MKKLYCYDCSIRELNFDLGGAKPGSEIQEGSPTKNLLNVLPQNKGSQHINAQIRTIGEVITEEPSVRQVLEEKERREGELRDHDS